MALYPDVATKMRQEVLDVCGNNIPTYEDIRKLKYGELSFRAVRIFLSTCFHSQSCYQ